VYDEAKELTKRFCHLVSKAMIDQDDRQRFDRFGWMMAVAQCSNENLNE